MKKILSLGLLLCIAGLPAFQAGGETPLAPEVLFGGWHVETVDPGYGAGLYSSIVIDTNQKAHVAYWDWDDQQIKYARQTLSGWEIVTVAGDHAGGAVSLALDSSNHPHIVYCELKTTLPLTCKTLWYAWNFGGGWEYFLLASYESPTFSSISLALYDMVPHIAYIDAPSGDLRYVTWDRASETPFWQTVDDGGKATGSASLRLIGGSPRIVYAYDGDIKYAWQAASLNWSTETVASDGDLKLAAGMAPCRKLSPWALPDMFVTYWDNTRYKIMLAKRELFSWSASEVYDDWVYSTIPLQSSGLDYCTFHIAFFDWHNTMRYSFHKPNMGVQWDTQTIEVVGESAPMIPGLGLDKYSRPHVSFFNGNMDSLRYAVRLINTFVPLVIRSP